MSEAVRSVMRNSAFTVGALVVVRIVGVVVLALLTNYLGPELFGQYTYAVYLGGLFSLVADFRLNVPFIRDVAQDRERGEGYLHQLFSLRAALGALCLLLLFATLPLAAPTPTERILLALIGAGSVAGALALTYAGPFQALERMELVAAQMLIQGGLSAGITLATIALRGPVWWVVSGPLIANLVSALALATAIRRRLRWRPWRWCIDLDLWKRLLQVAAPVAGVALLETLWFRLDIILLRHFHGERGVGIYGVPFRLIDALIALELAFLGAVFPVVSRLHARSEASFERAWEKLLTLVLVVALPLGASVQMLASQLLPLFGAAYIEGTAAFRWLIWVAVLVFVGRLVHLFLITANLQNWILLAFGVALALNLGLNLWLIPRWEALGASIAKVVSEAVAVALAAGVLRSRLPGMAWRCALRPILAAAGLAAVLWGGRGLGLLSLLPGLVVYGVVLWTTGAVGPEEVELLASWWRGRPGQQENGQDSRTNPDSSAPPSGF